MPNRHGWMCVFSAACAFAIGRTFGLIELYVFGVALLVCLLAAMVTALAPLPTLTCGRRADPELASVGDAARVAIELTNAGRRRSPALRLWEPVGAGGGAPMQVAALSRGEAASAGYRVPTERRGTVHLGPLQATRSDALGLCSRKFTISGSASIAVVPAVIPLAVPRVGAGGALGQQLRTKSFGLTGSEFHSMREYVPGDDLRRVNWRASARSTNLLVNLTEPEGLRRAVVVLDTAAARYRDHRSVDETDGFERAIVIAASLVNAIAPELTTRFVSDQCDISGHALIVETMRWLADATMSATDGAPTRRPSSAEGLGIVVVVTARADAHADDLAHSVGAPGDTSVIVEVSPTGAGPRNAGSSPNRLTVDGSSLAACANSWNLVVGGQDTAHQGQRRR